MQPQRIGKYTLDHRLGGGGMGEVYRGRVEGAAGFARTVAIKLVKPTAIPSATAIRLFLREGRMLAALNHRNIVSVFDLDMHEGQPFLVMECLEGIDLRALLKREAGPLAWEATAFVGAEIARGLAAAHALSDAEAEQGIVHGDLSPANVMLCFDGAVKILDFGLARASGAHSTCGDIRGKVVYLSPEALAGVMLDHRADIYALASTLRPQLCSAAMERG